MVFSGGFRSRQGGNWRFDLLYQRVGVWEVSLRGLVILELGRLWHLFPKLGHLETRLLIYHHLLQANPRNARSQGRHIIMGRYMLHILRLLLGLGGVVGL